MTQQQKAEAYQKELQSQLYVLMKRLATKQAFLQYYHSILSKCRSQRAAFEVVNLLYYLVFDEELYNSYDAFRKYKNKNLK
ncbi:hypothetical protein OD91_0865 [Lutibacter sp. Hel_I_33_5]|uniref:hypothetical protein n=1 Tax=Lutibacter sp. Hel_I_33_5 TaxID=1566289 RepID=UPI0011A56CB4|nr:hypothetical protein [Lutibacter sp. Hel_I_33_5]TVZ55610.1 hypothetical protein OD91_0865 [Lutibacter sp. Hel_I_33_5]